MPKDPAENIDRYKVRGGQLNEYELQRNNDEFARNEEELENVTTQDSANLIPGTPPEQRANRRQQLTRKTSGAAKKTSKTATKKSSKLTSKKSRAKKTTARKTGSSKSKKTTRKAGAKKSGTKKSARKKRSRK